MLKKYILKDLFVERYNVWLVERQKILDKNNKSHNYIFIKHNGDPAEETTARGWVDKIQKFLDVPFYPHLLRHNFCTRLSKIGLPPNLIKEIIGWQDVKMVETYDDVEIKDKEFKELDKLKEYLVNKDQTQ